MNLHRIATRIARDEEIEEEDMPEKMVEGEEIEFEPKWQRARSVYESRVFPLCKDLKQSIKDEDELSVKVTFAQLMDELVELSKAFGMRTLRNSLQTTVKKGFE